MKDMLIHTNQIKREHLLTHTQPHTQSHWQVLSTTTCNTKLQDLHTNRVKQEHLLFYTHNHKHNHAHNCHVIYSSSQTESRKNTFSPTHTITNTITRTTTHAGLVDNYLPLSWDVFLHTNKGKGEHLLSHTHNHTRRASRPKPAFVVRQVPAHEPSQGRTPSIIHTQSQS